MKVDAMDFPDYAKDQGFKWVVVYEYPYNRVAQYSVDHVEALISKLMAYVAKYPKNYLLECKKDCNAKAPTICKIQLMVDNGETPEETGNEIMQGGREYWEGIIKKEHEAKDLKEELDYYKNNDPIQRLITQIIPALAGPMNNGKVPPQQVKQLQGSNQTSMEVTEETTEGEGPRNNASIANLRRTTEPEAYAKEKNKETEFAEASKKTDEAFELLEKHMSQLQIGDTLLALAKKIDGNPAILDQLKLFLG